MTLDKAKKIAEAVLNGQTGSYVRAAHELAEFVMSLVPGVNVIAIEQSGDTVPPEPFEASPSVIPINGPITTIDTTIEVPIDVVVEEGELEQDRGSAFDDIAHLLDEPGDEK